MHGKFLHGAPYIAKILLTPYFLRPGGIIGLGEAEEDRIGLLHTLSTLPTHPESVPINALIAVKGTPLEDQKVILIYYGMKRLSIIAVLSINF